jgi:hypothetical protein
MVGQLRKTLASFAFKYRSRKLQAIFGLQILWLANGEKYFPKTLSNLQAVNFSPFLGSPFHGWSIAKNFGEF